MNEELTAWTMLRHSVEALQKAEDHTEFASRAVVVGMDASQFRDSHKDMVRMLFDAVYCPYNGFEPLLDYIDERISELRDWLDT